MNRSQISIVCVAMTASGANHYAMTNIFFNEPTVTASAYSAWRQGCHTDFHGAQTDANMRNTASPAQEEWLSHPTADANIGFLSADGSHSDESIFGADAYRLQVMSPAGDWGTAGAVWAIPATDLTPSCMTCHKAHGNQNAFGLIFADGTSALGEEGDGTGYRDICLNCHVQRS